MSGQDDGAHDGRNTSGHDRGAAAALTEAGYLILLSLAAAPLHGYRIMQVINDVFATDLRIGPGTLYRTLQRLAHDGLIAGCDGHAAESAEAERRIAYRITASGRQRALAEMRRLDALVRLGRVQLAPA